MAENPEPYTVTPSTNPQHRPFTTTFPDRAAWLAARRHSIGGSDAPQILGLTRYGSPMSIWADKCGLGPPDDQASEAMEWGLLLEPLVADRYHRETGLALKDPGAFTLVRNPIYPYFHCSPDRYVWHPERGTGLLSIKTTSAYLRDDWADDVPPPYQVQLQHEMLVTGLRWGAVAVLIGGQAFRYLDHVAYDERFALRLHDTLVDFWGHVEREEPPPADASEACKAALKKLYPVESGEVIALDAALVEADEAWLEASKQGKYWREKQDLAENQFRQALGEAAGGVLPNLVTWTNKSQTRKEYTVPESTYRVLRRSAKKG